MLGLGNVFSLFFHPKLQDYLKEWEGGFPPLTNKCSWLYCKKEKRRPCLAVGASCSCLVFLYCLFHFVFRRA